EGEEDAAAEAEDDDYEADSEDGEEAEDDDYDDDYEDESVTEPSSGTQRSVEDLDGEIRNVVSGDVLESESARSRTQETGFNASRGDSAGEGQSIPAAQEGGESRSQAVDLSTHSGLCFQPVDLPTMQGEPFGMRRADGNGLELLDAMAGRNSVFGYGCTPIRESLVSALSDHLGEGSRFADVADSGESLLSRKLEQVFAGSSSVFAESMAVLPSPDLAVEYAIQITRRFCSDRSFRTIALLGSDHGRTGMCRTASGQPYLHEGLGPMMAGFSHLPMGDLEALRAAIDEQTAGVLLSPIDLVNGAVACSADYIAGVRAVCNERGVLLIIDETQLVFGSTGNHFAFAALADIHADIVVASAGLFAGLPGGLVLASQHATAGIVRDLEKYPLLSAALMSTLDEMDTHGLPATVHDSAREFAVLIAEQLSGFEFVRDMRVTGMTIGIECDVNAVDVVAAAAANGLRVESAGDTAIRIQPPLLMSQEDRELLLKRLMDTMKAIERETAELTL
ncbi:aminotransferase class III-fold pyridoxal phosphate-dependent enzyme, partial [Rubripirellula sp.]